MIEQTGMPSTFMLERYSVVVSTHFLHIADCSFNYFIVAMATSEQDQYQYNEQCLRWRFLQQVQKVHV